MAMNVELKHTLEVANALGECVLWDEVRQEVLWTDLEESKLFVHDTVESVTRELQLKDLLCSFGLIAGGEHLICAFRTGIAIVERSSLDSKWLYQLPIKAGVRFNDGRVDRQGRFWVGSLVEGETDPPGATGELYSVTPDGTVRSHFDGIRIPNSICWSPGGETMYFADTQKREIHAFAFDVESGRLGQRSLFARTPKGAFPDGSTVDAEGYLWNAEWGSGRVVRYAPDGSIEAEIDLPVSQATCVAFGGENLSTLYVTTAKVGLSEEAIEAEPQAGDVFVYETSVCGLPEARFVNRTHDRPPQ